MVTAPACVACGFTLRFVPEQNVWGCDRCRASYPVAQPQPYSPYPNTLKDTLPAGAVAGRAKQRTALLIGVGVGVALAAGVVIALLVLEGSGASPAQGRTAADKVEKQTVAPRRDVDAAILPAATPPPTPDPSPPTAPPTPMPPPVTPDPPVVTHPPRTATGMPNCDKYRALILKLAKCPQLPQQARDALKQSFEQASAAWANIPASSQPAIDDACKQGLAAMQQGLSSYCP